MPHFRFVIRGSWRPVRDDYEGFFTSRTAKAANFEEGRAKVMAALSDEWSRVPGGKGLSLHVVDGWRISRWNAFRLGNAGHTFFQTADEEADAASIEAQATKAPRESPIWCLATAPGQAESEFSALN
jgi:hypothetical protein